MSAQIDKKSGTYISFTWNVVLSSPFAYYSLLISCQQLATVTEQNEWH